MTVIKRPLKKESLKQSVNNDIEISVTGAEPTSSLTREMINQYSDEFISACDGTNSFSRQVALIALYFIVVTFGLALYIV